MEFPITSVQKCLEFLSSISFLAFFVNFLMLLRLSHKNGIFKGNVLIVSFFTAIVLKLCLKSVIAVLILHFH